MADNFSDHLAILYETAGVAAGDIFIGSKAILPVDDGPYVKITDTGGTGNIRTHNSAPARAYDCPSAQTVVHCENEVTAMTLAKTLFDAAERIRSVEINLVWYREIIMEQSAPFPMGLDDSGRSRIAFNAMAVKRPS